MPVGRPVVADDFLPRAEHVWLTVDNERTPGLLLGWKQHNGHWQGLIASAHQDGDEDAVLRQGWLDAGLIERLPTKAGDSMSAPPGRG
jgi:hypothetical protein